MMKHHNHHVDPQNDNNTPNRLQTRNNESGSLILTFCYSWCLSLYNRCRPLRDIMTTQRNRNRRLTDTASSSSHFIRGVNLGGWLVLERYITPYQFAVTDCHTASGELCWYPNQASAPPPTHPDYKVCDASCRPHLQKSVFGRMDYPVDEWTLSQAFINHKDAERWLNYHFEYFMTRKEIEEIKRSGLTHLRVPIPHFILGDVQEGEPWVVGNRYKHFVRMCHWARELGLEVWPDIHTAPGSQNGFDNSGFQKADDDHSCKPWSSNPEHVARTLNAIQNVTTAFVRDGLQDVVTGFGLLNEPFMDCDREVYRRFLEDGLDIVRASLPDATVFVHDQFSASSYDDGSWWLDKRYNNTLLDSHYYQVFAEPFRALSPRQHIAFTCQGAYGENGIASCCYDGQAKSQGVQRMVSEWSVATDTLVVAMLDEVMDHIQTNMTEKYWNRTISRERRNFLSNFAQAQMVTYEAVNAGVSRGWFYWTAKMEGWGVFAEWDYLRGVREGWMPRIPDPTNSSQAVYGTCQEIIFRTADNMSIIEEFPDPAEDPPYWQLTDDVVVSHGQSLLEDHRWRAAKEWHLGWIIGSLMVVGVAVLRYYRSKRREYVSVEDTEIQKLNATMIL